MIEHGMDGIDLIVVLGKMVAIYCGLLIGWPLGQGLWDRRDKERWKNWH